MTHASFPYTIPLLPTPPIPRCSEYTAPTAQNNEEDIGRYPKTKEDYEREKIEQEEILESLKSLENEHFFFFEILVDSIKVLKDEPQESEVKEVAPLKVSINFGALPNMVISQESFTLPEGSDKLLTGKVVCEDEIKSVVEIKQDTMPQWNTKCGISCLFPMTPVNLIKSFQSNLIEVTLHRSNEEEVAPNVVLGQTVFHLDEDFCRCVLQSANMQIASTLPKSLIKQNMYSLKNKRNEESANISLMIRLACFGCSIITKCERQESSCTYIFKNSPIIENFKCQQHKFKNNSKPVLTKNNKDYCNCMKKMSGLVCPKPESRICTCVCKCEKTSQNEGCCDKLLKQDKCPFESNCPFDK